MKNAKITKFTTTIFGMIVEVEHIGRGATATVKDGEFAGDYKFASTTEMAFEILKDDLAGKLAKKFCGNLMNEFLGR